MIAAFTESVVEEAALAWLNGLGHAVLHGPEIAVGMASAERADPGYRDGVLEARVRQALGRLNPSLPPEALDDAFRRLARADAPSLIERNAPSTGCSSTASLSSTDVRTARSPARRRTSCCS